MMIEPEDDEPLFDDGADDDEREIEMPHGRRFGEGQPRGRGRPPGSPNRATILKRVARKRHRIKIDGRRRRINSVELVLHTILIEASRGNLQAIDLQEALQSKYTARLRSRPWVVRPVASKLSSDEWKAVYGLPRLPVEEVLVRFPHLKHVVARRGRDPSEPYAVP